MSSLFPGIPYVIPGCVLYQLRHNIESDQRGPPIADADGNPLIILNKKYQPE